MRLRGLFVLVLTPVLAADDLVVKSLVQSQPWNYHQRSHWWAALSLFLIPCVLGLALLPSRAVAASAGVLAGGGLGNLISALGNGMWVPNPFVVGSIAFNLADVFVVVGAMGLTAALGLLAIRHRDQLLPPRRWERAAARRLSRGSARGRQGRRAGDTRRPGAPARVRGR